MRNTKKGFTIIELVVVVAVIAILAAVLIPTFSGIIAKAKLNADEQTVANMNKYVAAADAEEEFVYPSDAINALYANGFNMGKFQTFSKGFHYAYDFDGNKFYLLDAESNVVFPAGSGKTAADLWGFFNNSKTDKVAEMTKYIALAPIVDADAFNAREGVFVGNTNYTLDLNGYTISVKANEGQQIKLLNGTAASDVAATFSADSSLVTREKMTAAQALAEAPVNGIVTIENKLFLNTTGKLSLEAFDNNVTAVVFKNCTFEQAADADFFIGNNELTLTSITLEKCTFNLYTNGTDNGKCLTIMSSASVATDVTITGCQFSGARGVLFGNEGLVSKYGKIVIENNAFVNTVNSKKALVQFGAKHEFIASSITIKDNNFQSGQVAIRIHDSINADSMKCTNVTISGNKFAENMDRVDGDNGKHMDLAAAWEAKIQ